MENQVTVFALPSEDQFKRDMVAINRFQQVVHGTMIEGHDFGVIPGTKKPTLLKPGAEKIAKLLNLSDDYEIIDRQEDWSKGFFRYLVRCRLCTFGAGTLVSTGMGECNSMESKYRWRWLGERELPAGIDTSKMVKQERKSNSGGHWTVYRMDNDDIYSQVNTILKMAKKRALVDAALSAGRLSEVFTQDIEDIGGDVIEGEARIVPEEKPDTSEHFCKIHNVPFFKKGKMTRYAHKVEATGEWCNEPDDEQQPAVPAEKQATRDLNTAFLATMRENKYTNEEIHAHITQKYNKQSLKELTPEELKQLTSDVRDYQVKKIQPDIFPAQ